MSKTNFRDLKKYCYFSCLSDGALEVIYKNLQPVAFSPGSIIIQEGEPADAFYLVMEGEVEVRKKTKWGQEAKISVFGQGNTFGEMALLTCSPRCCTVSARTDVKLLKLHKKFFNDIVDLDSTFSRIVDHKVRDYAQFNQLKTLQPFALLSPEKMAAFTNALVQETYPVGTDIITQGEKGDVYYIIKSGRVAVLKKMFEDEPEHVAIMHEGEGFGEEALITSSPRSATVQSLDETIVWTLAKPQFDDIMKASYLDQISPDEVLEKKEEVNYLDVRMKMEYDEERVPGSINIPLDEIRTRYTELNPDEEYFVYCLMGTRSASATFLLNSRGVRAKNIIGGMSAWPGPVEEGSDGVHTPFKPT
jgi:CRP-like cAMP-binding protein